MDCKDNSICQEIYVHRLKSLKLESLSQKGTFQGFWHRVLTKQPYREKFSSFVNYFLSVPLFKNVNS